MQAADVVARVHAAAADHEPLRIVGRGGWLHGGRPVSATQRIELSALSGITEYSPDDFTMTVGAGTTLAEIDAAARAHGQWLPLDPAGDGTGSIGATVATASAGPLATGFGRPRDHLLGIEFVNGRGAVIKGGGRVMKNVAGFDLVRLTTGAWGTLGIITSVTLRLRATVPGESLVAPLEAVPEAIERAASGLRHLAVPPLAAELVGSPLAAAMGLPGHTALLVRVGGNAQSIHAQRAALCALAPFQTADDATWHRLRASGGAADAVWRLSDRISRFAETWAASGVATDMAGGGMLHGSPLLGVVRCMVPAGREGDAATRVARAVAHPFAGRQVGEALPEGAWRAVPGTAGNDLSRRLRAAFDPAGILNPGIMGELT
jgi:glycolate oxidase FAD binding subunit